MDPASRRHQYAMVQHYDRVFFEYMFAYVDVRRELHQIWKPLRDFLDKYKIYASEYDFDTAWKRVQREYKRIERQQSQQVA